MARMAAEWSARLRQCLGDAPTGGKELASMSGAGLESVLDFLSSFRIDSEDVDAFAAVLHRPPADVDTLLGLEFTGQVRAVPDGRIVLAGEPLLEVTAPLPQAQLVETYVLNQVSHQTAIASKAARCVPAAAGHPLVDFSLRRTHGPQAGFRAARLSAMVGFPPERAMSPPRQTQECPPSTRWPTPTWRRSVRRKRRSGPSPAATPDR